MGDPVSAAGEKREEKLLELRDQIPPAIAKLVSAMLDAALAAAPRKFDEDVPRPAKKGDALAPRITAEQAAEYAREAASLDRADEMLEALQEWIKMELAPVRKDLKAQRRRYLRTIDVGRVKVDEEPRRKPPAKKGKATSLEFDLPPLGASLRADESLTITKSDLTKAKLRLLDSTTARGQPPAPDEDPVGAL